MPGISSLYFRVCVVNDKQMREPLFDYLETFYGKIRILEEKNVGRSRADSPDGGFAMDKITGFKGKYEFLSNAYPCFVKLDGELYSSVEHAFQAAKTTDLEVRKHFRVMNGADTAYYFGRHLDEVKKGTVIRPDWEDVRTDIMYNLVKDKFTRTEPFSSQAELKQKLLDTGDAYLENGNTYRDRFWGTVKGEGRNELGIILMKVRDEIREK